MLFCVESSIGKNEFFLYGTLRTALYSLRSLS
jgi:hypothetical protein